MDHSQWIDNDKGLVSRDIFVNRDLYDEELEKLFTRAWLFIGHESQIPNAGDYFTSRMGAESVILCRDQNKKIHVFLNTCRHRGMKVCLYDEGNTQTFTCPFHAWSYATDGQLVGVPHEGELYSHVLDKSQWSLIEVAKMVNFKGTVWATWDKDAPDFLAYLGPAKEHLDMVLDLLDGSEGAVRPPRGCADAL